MFCLPPSTVISRSPLALRLAPLVGIGLFSASAFFASPIPGYRGLPPVPLVIRLVLMGRFFFFTASALQRQCPCVIGGVFVRFLGDVLGPHGPSGFPFARLQSRFLHPSAALFIFSGNALGPHKPSGISRESLWCCVLIIAHQQRFPPLWQCARPPSWVERFSCVALWRRFLRSSAALSAFSVDTLGPHEPSETFCGSLWCHFLAITHRQRFPPPQQCAWPSRVDRFSCVRSLAALPTIVGSPLRLLGRRARSLWAGRSYIAVAPWCRLLFGFSANLGDDLPIGGAVCFPVSTPFGVTCLHCSSIIHNHDDAPGPIRAKCFFVRLPIDIASSASLA